MKSWLCAYSLPLRGKQQGRFKVIQYFTLVVLYMSGLKVSKLLLITVGDLKILTQFAGSGESLTVPVRDHAIAKQLLTSSASNILDSLASLIGDRPDSTPAFRAHYSSERPCARESLTLELNQILEPFQLSTKHLRLPQDPLTSYKKSLIGKLERWRTQLIHF